MTSLPAVLPQQTWIAYQLSQKEGGKEKILDKRVYHSASKLAEGFAGNWIEVRTRTHKGTTTRSIVVFYGLAGAQVEPIEELVRFCGEFGMEAEPSELVPVIESWRTR